MTIKVKNHTILFWVGILGVLFYVLAPIFFPDVPNLRQPELLPVYTLMMGLGQLLKGNEVIEKATKQLKERVDDSINEPKDAHEG